MSRAFISDPQWAGWEDIRHMRSTGVPWDEIAHEYKISKTRLCRYAKLNGIDTGGVEREDAVRIDWQDVQRQRIGVSDPTLRRMVAKLGMDFPAPKPRRINDGIGSVKTMTLCWQCANAAPDKSGKRGCAWSRSFKPVKGWDADETRLYSDKPTQSYHVRQCPEFVRG